MNRCVSLAAALTVLAFPCAPQAQARSAELLTWVDKHSVPASDLAAVRSAIGNARIVALGEQTHGDAVNLKLKADIVRYLHEKGGFDVLIFESGLYDVDGLWHLAKGGGSLDVEAPGELFFMYAKSGPVRDLLRYVDKSMATSRPLYVAGMDSQHSGEISSVRLLPELKAEISARGIKLPQGAPWESFEPRARRVISLDRTKPSRAEQTAFFRSIDAMAQGFCPSSNGEASVAQSAGLWCRVTMSLRAQAMDYWRGTAERDVQMAQNAQWLLEGPYKGKRAILWAHTYHLSRGYLDFEDAAYGWNAGSNLARVYGRDYYAINFTTAAGAYLDANDLSIRQVPAATPGTLEAAFVALDKEARFLDLRRLPESLRAVPARQLFYEDRGWTLGDGDFDAVFYQERSVPTSFDR